MKEKRKASSGAAKPLSASVRSTSTQSGADLGGTHPDLRERRTVADPVAELREAELQVEHEVRVAQAQRHLRQLEVVEVGGPGEVVGTIAVARLRGGDRVVDEPLRLGDASSNLGKLVARRGCDRGRRERNGADQREQDGEPAHQPWRSSTASVEVSVDLVHRRLDLVRTLPGLDIRPEVGRNRLFELLHEFVILLAERAFDVLEVLEVRVADGLLRSLRVAFADLVDGGVKSVLISSISATASAGVVDSSSDSSEPPQPAATPSATVARSRGSTADSLSMVILSCEGRVT